MVVKLLRTAGWIGIALAIVSLIVFGVIRTLDMFGRPHPADAFGLRYVEHPVVALVHLGSGLLFVIFAPLQFIPQIRRRHLALHRMSGRILLVLGAFSGVFALAAAFVLPAFGGLATQLSTLVFGAIFLYSLGQAYRNIRQKRVAAHREWMIRAFALGLGAATIRALIGLSEVLAGLTIDEVFAASF